MITVFKKEKGNMDINRRPTYERISLEPRGPIPSTLEDPDESSGVHQ